MEKNSTLRGINLESNDIRDEGCKALTRALEKNSSVVSINVENNREISTDLKAGSLKGALWGRKEELRAALEKNRKASATQ